MAVRLDAKFWQDVMDRNAARSGGGTLTLLGLNLREGLEVSVGGVVEEVLNKGMTCSLVKVTHSQKSNRTHSIVREHIL